MTARLICDKMQYLMISYDASQVKVYSADGQSKSSFFPFSGVNEELETFIHDVSQATLKVVGDVNSHAFMHG